MFNFINLFSSFFEFLQNSKIDIVESWTNTKFLSLSERFLKKDVSLLSEKWNINMNDEDLKYFNLSGVSICWSYTNELNQFIYGGFHFNGFGEALIQDSDFWDLSNSINEYQPDDKELEFLKKLNWFEKQSWGDDGRYGCFFRQAGDFPPQIYFYDNSTYFPMNLTLDEYFQAMTASCAVRGWQYFYIDIPDNIPSLVRVNKDIVLKDVELAVELLPKLFPDRDFSYHIGKMDYIRDRLK
jgi:hypothetical protein